MKKLFLSSYLLGAFFTLNAQTISDIKNSSKRIDGRMGNSFYNHDIRQYKELNSMLNLNVFEYYELQKQYDTELKKKVFKDSDEYKMKFSELESKKLELKKTPYYLDFEPIYYERNNQIKYDLNTKSFGCNSKLRDPFF